MTEAYDDFKFEYQGQTIYARVYRDDDSSPPWESEDGHGPVSDWTRRDKRPGEMLLNVDGQSCRYYNYAEAVRIARRDGWGLAEEERDKLSKELGREPTRKEICAHAALLDYERLRDWCLDHWHYCGIGVSLHEKADDADFYQHACWGFESDMSQADFEEAASELAVELIAAEAERKAEEENHKERAGVALANLLHLKADKQGLYKTAWGTKTPVGLAESVARVLREGEV